MKKLHGEYNGLKKKDLMWEKSDKNNLWWEMNWGKKRKKKEIKMGETKYAMWESFIDHRSPHVHAYFLWYILS